MCLQNSYGSFLQTIFLSQYYLVFRVAQGEGTKVSLFLISDFKRKFKNTKIFKNFNGPRNNFFDTTTGRRLTLWNVINSEITCWGFCFSSNCYFYVQCIRLIHFNGFLQICTNQHVLENTYCLHFSFCSISSCCLYFSL